MTKPHEDLIEESERIAEAARKKKIGLKLLGGAGIHAHSPSARRAPLKRKYGDLDYAISKKDRKAVIGLFRELGYDANDRFNLMNGDRGHEHPAVSPSDLLLSKLQIYEVNRKDLVDVIALLLDHPIAANDEDAIDPQYVARLACANWGLCRTVEINLGKLRHTVDELDIDHDLVKARIDELWTAIEGGPKPLKWRVRAQVGDRVRWYELPEETRSPYQPE